MYGGSGRRWRCWGRGRSPSYLNGQPSLPGAFTFRSTARVLLAAAYRTRAGPAGARTQHECACEDQAAGNRRHGLGQRLEPAGEGSCPEHGSSTESEDHGRVLAGRAQDKYYRADENGPGPHGSLDAFGERERRRRHDQDRCECAVQTAPRCGARRQSRSGSQIPVQRKGCERILHGVASG